MYGVSVLIFRLSHKMTKKPNFLRPSGTDTEYIVCGRSRTGKYNITVLLYQTTAFYKVNLLLTVWTHEKGFGV